ncbi:MAG: HAD family hydrolase [Roseiflexaceae bacterium]
MYRAILFDLDDTLYDLRSYWSGRLRLALDLVLPRYPQLDRDALVRAALAERVYMAQWPDFLRRQSVADEALIAAAHEIFCREWFEQMALYEDALHTLEALRPRYRLGLITNGPSEIQRRKIERFGLVNYLDVLIVSEEAGVAKPDPAIFALALAQLGVGPAEALFIGDSPEHDLRGAAAAGMACIWMNPGKEQLPAGLAPPLATIERLGELLPLLEQLNKEHRTQNKEQNQ